MYKFDRKSGFENACAWLKTNVQRHDQIPTPKLLIFLMMDLTLFLYLSDRSKAWNSKVIPSTLTLSSKGLKYLTPASGESECLKKWGHATCIAVMIVLRNALALTSLGRRVQVNLGCVYNQTDVGKLNSKQIRLATQNSCEAVSENNDTQSGIDGISRIGRWLTVR